MHDMPALFARLDARAVEANTLLCVGLDPHPEDLNALEGSAADAALAWCSRLIEQTHPYALAFKPNAAFFEALGAEGVAVLGAVIAKIRALDADIPVILDVKRGDIASTGRAYACAAYDSLGADAVTVSPYMGRETITPFQRDDRGVFVLCKTSNEGAHAMQDVLWMGAGAACAADQVAKWADAVNIGLVVGATHPVSLARARALAPKTWILSPGVGAQGADLVGALRAGLRADGAGVLINASRAISRAEDPGAAACALRDAIRDAARTAQADATARQSEPAHRREAVDPAREQLAVQLVTSGCVRFGEFLLKSGATSPIYIDLRRLVAVPSMLAQVADACAALIHRVEAEHGAFDHIAALPYAALPIGTAISLVMNRSMVYPRKEAKAYGTKVAVEGVFEPGQRVVMIDDLISTGGSKVEAAEKLRAVSLEADHTVVLIDRRSANAGDELAPHGLTLHAVFTLPALLELWTARGLVDEAKAREVRAFLST